MLIKKYKLKNDHAYLYLNYIGTEYRVSRSDGSIEYMAEGIWKLCKEYTIVMTIYDLLCYSEDKNAASTYRTVAACNQIYSHRQQSVRRCFYS